MSWVSFGDFGGGIRCREFEAEANIIFRSTDKLSKSYKSQVNDMKEWDMTKADLIAVIEKQANLPHHQAEKIVNICFDSMIQALFDNERIEIRGFGSFANRNYKAYEGRNPKTGKVVKVSPKKVPFFKVGKELKEMVDEGKDKYVIREA
jgi:integration host factor subunit beta